SSSVVCLCYCILSQLQQYFTLFPYTTLFRSPKLILSTIFNSHNNSNVRYTVARPISGAFSLTRKKTSSALKWSSSRSINTFNVASRCGVNLYPLDCNSFFILSIRCFIELPLHLLLL